MNADSRQLLESHLTFFLLVPASAPLTPPFPSPLNLCSLRLPFLQQNIFYVKMCV